jgi:DNA repair ATPase RecN
LAAAKSLAKDILARNFSQASEDLKKVEAAAAKAKVDCNSEEIYEIEETKLSEGDSECVEDLKESLDSLEDIYSQLKSGNIQPLKALGDVK